eukprot:10815071-Lingulodinium_polyedra.AAC.1
MVRAQGEVWYRFTFFDIEKAYPRVCRDALWEVMERRGCDKRMMGVCRALHEHTAYSARVHGGESRYWLPDRGLREGCPSSP